MYKLGVTLEHESSTAEDARYRGMQGVLSQKEMNVAASSIARFRASPN